MKMRKLTVGKEALRQIEMMREMLKEDNWRGTSYHANSASNYLSAICAANLEIPAWIEKDRGHLRAQGWRW